MQLNVISEHEKSVLHVCNIYQKANNLSWFLFKSISKVGKTIDHLPSLSHSSNLEHSRNLNLLLCSNESVNDCNASFVDFHISRLSHLLGLWKPCIDDPGNPEQRRSEAPLPPQRSQTSRGTTCEGRCLHTKDRCFRNRALHDRSVIDSAATPLKKISNRYKMYELSCLGC